MIIDLLIYGVGEIVDVFIGGDPGAGRLKYRMPVVHAGLPPWIQWEVGEVSQQYADAFALLNRMVEEIPCELSADSKMAVKIMRDQTARLLNQGVEQTSSKSFNERGVYFLADPEKRPLLSDVASQLKAFAQHIERLCAREQAQTVLASFDASAPSAKAARANTLSPWVWVGAAAAGAGLLWAVAA